MITLYTHARREKELVDLGFKLMDEVYTRGELAISVSSISNQSDDEWNETLMMIVK